MMAVSKGQNMSRLDISKYGLFEVIYWMQTYCTVLQLQGIDC